MERPRLRQSDSRRDRLKEISTAREITKGVNMSTMKKESSKPWM